MIDPLIRDRIAIAQAKTGGKNENAALVPASIAIWASVSEETDAKIREQVKAGTFPIRLKSEEWSNGNIVWLLDVIAPTQKLATVVLANFNKIAGQNNIHIHPMVNGLVDPDVLKKLATTPAAGSESSMSSTLN